MAEKLTPVEERIIQAAIESIEKYGLQGTTNRKIAELAGVNGAAVNYYFRSKEALIERCMQITLKNAFDWEEFSRLPAETPQELAAAISEDLISGACSYPGLTRAHFYDLVAVGSDDAPVIEKINEFGERLVQELRERGSRLDEAELRMAVAQLLSAVLMASLVPSLFSKSLGIDMQAEETRREFVRRLVERLL
jgi:AcrR family transcriptional regulator